MLATRSRLVGRLGRLSTSSRACRRFFADQPATTPSSPAPATTSAPVNTTAPRPGADYAIPIPKQRGSPKLRDGYSGGFYLALLGGLLVSAPVITYTYWEHRKAHMRSKKEEKLREIQARAGVA